MYPEEELEALGSGGGVNISFARDMLRGFDDVCKYSEEGLKTAKEVAGLFKKQQEIEGHYAKSMAKLSQSFRQLIPEDKRNYLPPPSVESQDDTAAETIAPTCLSTGLFNVIDHLLVTSKQHEHLAAMLAQSVCEPLLATVRELEAARRQLTQEGQRQSRSLQDAYTVLKRAEMSHAQTQKEAADLVSDRDKAQSNFLSKTSTLSKVRTAALLPALA